MGDRHRNHEDLVIYTIAPFTIATTNALILSFPIPWASAMVAEVAVIIHTAVLGAEADHIQGVTVEDGGPTGAGVVNLINEVVLESKNDALLVAAGVRLDGHGNGTILTKGDKVMVRSHESGTPGGTDGSVEVIVVLRKLGDRRIID